MKVLLAVLADYANVTFEGKLNVMGIFDVLYCKQFPAVHPEMQLVFRLEFVEDEKGTTAPVEVKLVGPTGNELRSISGQLTIPRNGSGGTCKSQHAIRLLNTEFDAPGAYSFRILVSGEDKSVISFEVAKAQD